MNARLAFALALGVALAPGWCMGQNLVPNGSFEEFTMCPDSWNQMERAVGWSSYRGSPDYLHSCDLTNVVSVPLSLFGNCNAAHGEAYAGIIAWETGGPSNQREYFGGALSAPLIPGIPVTLSFEVIMATGGLQQDCRWSVDGVGMRFSMAPFMEYNNSPSPNAAAVYLATAPLDTVIWTTITGTYIPDSAYEYVVLGDFFSDEFITSVQFNPGGNINRAYAFIDNVCVSYNPSECSGQTGIQEFPSRHFSVLPNPFVSELCVYMIEAAPPGTTVRLRDVLGHTLWSGVIDEGEYSVVLKWPHLADGLYVVCVQDPERGLSTTMVVHASP